jgi:hypothetical protein
MRVLATITVYAIALMASMTGAAANAAPTPPTVGTEQEAVSSDANVPAPVARRQADEIARGDPARWYQEDTSAAARQRRLEKEVGAALQEALGACHAEPVAQRAACAKAARTLYRQELAAARAPRPETTAPAR